MKIIGIAGTNGSGKDTLGEILAQDHGFLFVSISDLLRHEAKARNLPVERENLRKISAEWRAQYGLGVLMDKAVEELNRQKGDFKGLAISNLRNVGEADEIHKLGGIIVWVDAEPKARYQRIYSRRRSREDQKTFEQFLAEEQEEMHHSGDETNLNTAGVKARADIFVDNQGSKEDLKSSVKTALGL